MNYASHQSGLNSFHPKQGSAIQTLNVHKKDLIKIQSPSVRKPCSHNPTFFHPFSSSLDRPTPRYNPQSTLILTIRFPFFVARAPFKPECSCSGPPSHPDWKRISSKVSNSQKVHTNTLRSRLVGVKWIIRNYLNLLYSHETFLNNYKRVTNFIS